MSNRVIDSADLGFVIKMVKGHVIKAVPCDFSMPAIILCCSENVEEEKFARGSIVIAVLGGATRLPDGFLACTHSDTASSFLRQQIKEARKEYPDFPIILIVDTPCIALGHEAPLDVIQQIRDMISGLGAINLGSKIEVTCFLRINTSAGGTYYKIDRRLWALWYENYEIDVLDRHDDDDPGADDGLGPNDEGLDIDTRR